jgi:hypothetical protein
MQLAGKMCMKYLKQETYLLFLLCTILISFESLKAQVPFKIFLVGDAGDHKEPGSALKNVQKELLDNPNSAVIFLGDNSYKNILWDLLPYGYKGFDSTENTIEKVRSQLNILDRYKGWVYFIPGNHDWWNRKTYEKGKNKLRMEENFIRRNLRNNTNIANPDDVFTPTDGNYGPEFVDLNNGTIRIVFIDTYRIIQTGIKKSKIPEAEKTFYGRLDSVIKTAYLMKEKILVVAHHPVHVAGPYNHPVKSPYIFARIKASSPDFPSYKEMITRINEILIRYPGIYYASGHAHTLQYFNTKDSIHYIISGAGSKERMLSEKEIKKYNDALSPNEFLMWNSGGFFEIKFDGENTTTTMYYDDGSKKRQMQ